MGLGCQVQPFELKKSQNGVSSKWTVIVEQQWVVCLPRQIAKVISAKNFAPPWLQNNQEQFLLDVYVHLPYLLHLQEPWFRDYRMSCSSV